MLFKLRGVEEDEAEEIRALLTERGIDFYETSNGRWGLGFAAIWLRDDACFEQAKILLDDYQDQRFEQARTAYNQLCLEGGEPTLWHRLKTHPAQVIFVLLAVCMITSFMLLPFLFL